MEDCIFCKIANNEIPTTMVYQDNEVAVFLSIEAVVNGHLLIVPKAHYKDLSEIDPKVLTHMIEVINNEIYPLMKEKLGCDGLTIVQNNDYGQEIKHFHIHFIPRYTNDEVKHLSNREVLKDKNERNDLIKYMKEVI